MKMIIINGLLLLSLFGCSASTEKVVNVDKEPNVMSDAKIEKLHISNETKQVDDFKVSIDVDDNLVVSATITYIGGEPEKEIYHAGDIFWYRIYQQDGDFKYESAMTLPLLNTTLIQNEPHTIKFNWDKDLQLEEGLYEFEVIADFSLDSTNIVGSQLTIPVSKLQEVQESVLITQ